MPKLRTKYLPIIVLLAISQPACDLDFSGIGEGIGEGLGGGGDYDFCPPTGPCGFPIPRQPNPAILITVQRLTYATGSTYGVIRDGSFVGTLRVNNLGGAPFNMGLEAGYGRPGTYDVTIAHPGIVTWDTTGVVVVADSNGAVQTVRWSMQLEETPRCHPLAHRCCGPDLHSC